MKACFPFFNDDVNDERDTTQPTCCSTDSSDMTIPSMPTEGCCCSSWLLPAGPFRLEDGTAHVRSPGVHPGPPAPEPHPAPPEPPAGASPATAPPPHPGPRLRQYDCTVSWAAASGRARIPPRAAPLPVTIKNSRHVRCARSLTTMILGDFNVVRCVRQQAPAAIAIVHSDGTRNGPIGIHRLTIREAAHSAPLQNPLGRPQISAMARSGRCLLLELKQLCERR